MDGWMDGLTAYVCIHVCNHSFIQMYVHNNCIAGLGHCRHRAPRRRVRRRGDREEGQEVMNLRDKWRTEEGVDCLIDVSVEKGHGVNNEACKQHMASLTGKA